MNYLYDTTPSCFIILYISICQYSLFSIPTFQLSKMVRHAVNKHSGMRRHSGTLSRVAKAKRSLALAKNKTGQQEFLLPNVKNQLAKEMQYADFRNNLVCPVIMRKKKKVKWHFHFTVQKASQCKCCSDVPDSQARRQDTVITSTCTQRLERSILAMDTKSSSHCENSAIGALFVQCLSGTKEILQICERHNRETLWCT